MKEVKLLIFIASLFVAQGTAGQPKARFGKEYFVLYDYGNGGIAGYKGGRWFEADIKFEKTRNGLYDVTFHDGDTGSYTAEKISQLGKPSNEGDQVVCYRTKANQNWDFAFLGNHKKNEKGNKIMVEYADGVTQKEDKTSCHKLVTLNGLQGPFNARFGKQYFVRYDYGNGGVKGYESGRWFEATIRFKDSKGFYYVTFHDNDTGKYKADAISTVGVPSEEGDEVLSYRNNTNQRFAFKGVHTKTDGGKITVQYDDGEIQERDAASVHKLVLLHKGKDFQICASVFKNIIKPTPAWPIGYEKSEDYCQSAESGWANEKYIYFNGWPHQKILRDCTKDYYKDHGNNFLDKQYRTRCGALKKTIEESKLHKKNKNSILWKYSNDFLSKFNGKA